MWLSGSEECKKGSSKIKSQEEDSVEADVSSGRKIAEITVCG